MEQTYSWTYKVIKSCSSDNHFDCADALINLFARKYGENSAWVIQLKMLRADKWVTIHGILV